MSITSRQRQSIRDARLGRTKPAYHPRAVHNEYEPSPFNITSFQKAAHESLVAGLNKDHDKEAGRWGARIPRWIEAQADRVKNWAPWRRDGFESEVHYAVHHNERGLWFALREAGESHPLFAMATRALELGLIKL